ncbi:MAG: TonB-dependent receptor [Pirellulaceae bacterium]
MDSYSTTISYTRIKEGSSQTRFNSNAANAVPTRLEEGEFTDDMLGVNAAATKDLCEFGQVTYGFDYYYEDINASRVRTNNPADPNSVPIATDPQYPDDSIADRFGLFLNWDVMLTDRLGLNTGVRYENLNMSATPNFDGLGDIHFQRTYQDWIASVGLNYKLTEKVRAVGGIYEGFRAPTLDDLTANKTAIQNVQTVPRLGDLDIQPEHTRTYEVGLKTNGDFVRLQAIQWWTDFESVIGREFVGTEQFLANQQATLNGTELAGDILLTDAWSLYGNFSYVYGRNDTVGEPFSRIPPTQGIVGLRWANPQTARYFDIYTWLVRRQDRYASANLGDVRFIPGGTPGYGTLNLRMGAAWMTIIDIWFASVWKTSQINTTECSGPA